MHSRHSPHAPIDLDLRLRTDRGRDSRRDSFDASQPDKLDDLHCAICDQFGDPPLPLAHELARVEAWHEKGVAIAADALERLGPGMALPAG